MLAVLCIGCLILSSCSGIMNVNKIKSQTTTIETTITDVKTGKLIVDHGAYEDTISQENVNNNPLYRLSILHSIKVAQTYVTEYQSSLDGGNKIGWTYESINESLSREKSELNKCTNIAKTYNVDINSEWV